jgi:hypothetical protein
MATQLYNHFKTNLCSGNINLGTANIMLMLVSGAYTFSHSHANTGSITAQVSSPNYTPGGKKIDNTSIKIDSVDNEAVLSGSPVTFSTITCSPSYGIVYVSGATTATSYLIGQLDFGAQTVTAADFTVNWNTEGIFNLL